MIPTELVSSKCQMGPTLKIITLWNLQVTLFVNYSFNNYVSKTFGLPKMYIAKIVCQNVINYIFDLKWWKHTHRFIQVIKLFIYSSSANLSIALVFPKFHCKLSLQTISYHLEKCRMQNIKYLKLPILLNCWKIWIVISKQPDYNW